MWESGITVNSGRIAKPCPCPSCQNGGRVNSLDSIHSYSRNSCLNNTSEEFSESAVRSALTSFTDSVGENEQYDFIRSLSSYLNTLQVDVDGTERGLFPFVGNEATILNFSNAYKNGVARVSPIPEPAGAGLAVLGAIALAVSHRRRRS